MILTVDYSDDHQINIGLELALIEGEYDSVLEWPFNKTFELVIVKQRENENIFRNESAEHQNYSNIKQMIIPFASNCSRHSFQRPIERNPGCGRNNFITFNRISQLQDYIKMGNLHLKARIYLNDL
jgi:hypothetical protein